MTYLNPEIIPVPTQDSADNDYIQHVVGNKTDTHDGDSLYAMTETLLDHVHSEQQVYPTLANGIVVTAGASWVLGNFVEIVPASTITSDYDLHHISIEAISANDTYQLAIYKGAVSSEILLGTVRFTKDAIQSGLTNQVMQTVLVDANERISAKVASASGSNNVTIGIVYHTY